MGPSADEGACPACAGWNEAAEKVRGDILSRRPTQMNSDKPILFNPRLSAFLGGL